MSPRSLLVRPSKGTILSGLAGGATHAGLAGVLWLWFGFATRGTTAPFLLYVGLGTLAVGAIPSALWSAERLRSPLLLVVGLFVATAYGTWETSVSQSPTPTPVGPTPFGWYLLGWVVVLGMALLVGAVEFAVRRRRGRGHADSASP